MYGFLKIVRTPRKICTYTGTHVWVWKIQKWRKFHGIVQWYGLMLHIAVTLHGNFLHLVTSLTCYSTVLCYIHLQPAWCNPKWPKNKMSDPLSIFVLLQNYVPTNFHSFPIVLPNIERAVACKMYTVYPQSSRPIYENTYIYICILQINFIPPQNIPPE